MSAPRTMPTDERIACAAFWLLLAALSVGVWAVYVEGWRL